MRVGGQRHAPAALPPRKTRYPLYRRLGRSGRVRKISPPNAIRFPDRPASSESLNRLRYPGLSLPRDYQQLVTRNVTGTFGALSVFGRPIKGMIRLRPEQVWTCNVTRHHRPLLSLSGSHNKLGTPWCNGRRILLRHETRGGSVDRNSVTCQSLATLRCYGR
jgi:hypothetical protein